MFHYQPVISQKIVQRNLEFIVWNSNHKNSDLARQTPTRIIFQGRSRRVTTGNCNVNRGLFASGPGLFNIVIADNESLSNHLK